METTVQPYHKPLSTMARIAEDSDFEGLKHLIDDNDGWMLELSKADAQVYTRPVEGCSFNMVKIYSFFYDITAELLFDVLLDPDYRKEWDTHMLASKEIGCFNVNNDVGYYAMSCPPPLKPRDFVLLRSWLDTGPNGEQMLISRSVPHKDYPPKKGYVRAVSHITGFIVRTNGRARGCELGYVAHCDPQGTLPPWLVNKVTHSLGPRMLKDLRKAASNYENWKNSQLHHRKPWRNPEEITCPRILLDECIILPDPFDNLTESTTILTPSSSKPARQLPQIQLQHNGPKIVEIKDKKKTKEKRKFFGK